jgi:hypothetical protein
VQRQGPLVYLVCKNVGAAVPSADPTVACNIATKNSPPTFLLCRSPIGFGKTGSLSQPLVRARMQSNLAQEIASSPNLALLSGPMRAKAQEMINAG